MRTRTAGPITATSGVVCRSGLDIAFKFTRPESLARARDPLAAPSKLLVASNKRIRSSDGRGSAPDRVR